MIFHHGDSHIFESNIAPISDENVPILGFGAQKPDFGSNHAHFGVLIYFCSFGCPFEVHFRANFASKIKSEF